MSDCLESWHILSHYVLIEIFQVKLYVFSFLQAENVPTFLPSHLSVIILDLGLDI